MPIQEAAKLLGTGVTVLKRKCRQYNIPRWPFRKLKSLDKLYTSMSALEAQQAEQGIDAENIRETKLKLFVERESMLWDPAISLNQETKKLRQSNFKYEYKVRQGDPDEFDACQHDVSQETDLCTAETLLEGQRVEANAVTTRTKPVVSSSSDMSTLGHLQVAVEEEDNSSLFDPNGKGK
eukprot:scaffold19519_cov53-Prasinocladus_malaysianus.AAC.1